MQEPRLNPTPDQTFEIVGDGAYNFIKILAHTRRMLAAGEVEEACNEHFQAVQRLIALLPEDEEVNLEWNDGNTRAALELLRLSAADHFLIDDFEMSAALLEQLLALDPEDHTCASELLAYDYLALGEQELFDEIIDDVPDQEASRHLLLLWAAFLHDGKLPDGELQYFKTRFAPYFTEFTAETHPADDIYLRDIESEHPSKAAQARELWLQTENLRAHRPEFIRALRETK